MKKLIGLFTIVTFLILILYSCQKKPLITQEYTFMQVHIEEQIVYETDNKEGIEEVIEEINTASRETTYEMSLPEPIGEIVFHYENDSLIVNLYGSGAVTIDEYLVETSFEF